MRKLIAVIAFMGISLCLHRLNAQRLVQQTAEADFNNDPSRSIHYVSPNTKQVNTTGDWRKHKRFKTAGWIALGVGVPLTLAGLITTIASVENPRVKSSTGEWLAGAGLISTIGSIPLFILSSKYKRRAKNQMIDVSFNFKGNGFSLLVQR
jgi:hypothetical protein